MNNQAHNEVNSIDRNEGRSSQAHENLDNLDKPGKYLQGLRNEIGLTQHEVADKLHLLPSNVRAIEADEFSHFSAEVYIKGYLRSYARLLQVDPEEVLKRYQVHFGGQFEREYSFNNTQELSAIKHAKRSARQSELTAYLPMTGAVAFLIVVMLLWFNDDAPNTSSVEVASADEVIIDNHDQTIVKKLVVQSEQEADIKQSSSVSLAENEFDTIENEIDEDVTQQQEAPPVTATVESMDEEISSIEELLASTNAAGNEVEGGVAQESGSLENQRANLAQEDSQVDKQIIEAKDNLFISFSGDCWVEVKDMQDNILVSALKKAQDTLSLEGKGPFKVTLGYAPVVTLDYNGERIEIDSNRRTNSARLVVGRS